MVDFAKIWENATLINPTKPFQIRKSKLYVCLIHSSDICLINSLILKDVWIFRQHKICSINSGNYI